MRAKIGDSPIQLLIDSGASVCLLDLDVYSALHAADRASLSSTTTSLKGADNHQLKLHGETVVDLTMNDSTFSVRMVVANLGGLQGILGMDFLSAQQAKLDMEEGVLVCGEEEYELYHRQDASCHLVRLDGVVEVPGRTLVQVKGTIPVGVALSGEAILECHEMGLAQDGLMPPRSLVTLGKSGEVHFNLVNFEGEPVRLLPGTPIAELTLLAENGDVICLWPLTDCCVKEPKANEEAGVCSKEADQVCHHIGKSSPSIAQSPTGENLKKSTPLQLSSNPVSAIKDSTDPLPDHLVPLYEEAVQHINTSEVEEIKHLLLESTDLFAAPGEPLGRTHLVEHVIDTGDAKPVKMPFRRFGPYHRKIIAEEVQSMLDKGVITPSNSPWNNPLVLVRKADGSTRCCEDARSTNELTRKDAYPIPYVTDCIDALAGAKLFCTMDLNSGFWQIPLEESSKAKTAFSTPDGGHYQFEVLPFGLCNAPATFERLMELVLQGLRWEQCLVFLDDIIVFGANFQQTLKRLKHVFQRLRAANLKLKSSKCHFFQEEVHFLGHVVSAQGVRPDPRKIVAVSEWPTPRKLRDVRSFLGLASYYRKFIERFSKIASPLTALTEKNKRFVWDEDCARAFQTLKDALVNAPILDYPSPDLHCKYILDTDASEYAVGACLSQVIDGTEKVIAYASKTLSGPQRRYCVTYRELLAVIIFTQHFRHYLLGRKFLIRTDHASLRWLDNFRDIDHGMVARWITRLSEFDYSIEHRKGAQHGNADGLSRRPEVKCRRTCKRKECPDCVKIVGFTLTPASDKPEEPEGNSASLHSHTDQDASERITQDPHDEDGTNEPAASNSHTHDETVMAADDTSGSNGAHEEKEAEMPQQLSNWMDCLTLEEIAAKQEEDPHLSLVKRWKEQDEDSPPDKDDLATHSEIVKALCARWKNLVIHKGVLYRKWSEKHDPGVTTFQLVAPASIQTDIFEKLHGSRLGGHFGITRTIANFRRRFYWVRMKADLQRWCQECIECALAKGSPAHRVRLKPMTVGAFNERVAVDMVGPLPQTEDGYVYLLVLSEYFTKYLVLIPTKTRTTIECADSIMTHYISIFGCPQSLHSDQGGEFGSELFTEMCKLLGVSKTRTTPHHPRCDGLVERANRTILQMLRTLVNEYRDDWDTLAPYLAMAYRATPHASTGLSPNLMLFGREIEMPVDIMYGLPARQEARFRCRSEYVRWLRHAMQKAHEMARMNLKKAADRQKRNYNANVQAFKQEMGEYCFRYIPPGGSTKMVKCWHGPYKVLQKVSDFNFLIQLSPKSRPVRVHIDNLKPHQGRTPPIWNKPITQPAEPSEESEVSEQSSDDSSPDEAMGEVPPVAHSEEEAEVLEGWRAAGSIPLGQDDEVSGSSDSTMEEKPVRRRGGRIRTAPERLDL